MAVGNLGDLITRANDVGMSAQFLGAFVTFLIIAAAVKLFIFIYKKAYEK